jgi:hypothetical protein
MRARVRAHRWLCGVFAAVLLFGQTAALAYACQGMQTGARAAGDVVMVEAMAGCTGHADADAAPEHPLMCKAHCQADQQSVNTGSAAADLPPADLVGAVLWHLPEPQPIAVCGAFAPAAQPAGPTAGFPPLYLSLLVLRN